MSRPLNALLALLFLCFAPIGVIHASAINPSDPAYSAMPDDSGGCGECECPTAPGILYECPSANCSSCGDATATESTDGDEDESQGDKVIIWGPDYIESDGEAGYTAGDPRVHRVMMCLDKNGDYCMRYYQRPTTITPNWNEEGSYTAAGEAHGQFTRLGVSPAYAGMILVGDLCPNGTRVVVTRSNGETSAQHSSGNGGTNQSAGGGGGGAGGGGGSSSRKRKYGAPDPVTGIPWLAGTKGSRDRGWTYHDRGDPFSPSGMSSASVSY
ncbi:MAG: hypothetical protein ACOCZK_08070, partial [Planctomycetota bacterium]